MTELKGSVIPELYITRNVTLEFMVELIERIAAKKKRIEI